MTSRYGLPSKVGVGLLGIVRILPLRVGGCSCSQQVSIAQAQFYPDVTLSAFIGYQAFGLDHLFDSGNDAGAIGPAIYLPLFTGGRLEGS